MRLHVRAFPNSCLLCGGKMQSIGMSRRCFGCTRILLITAALFVEMMALAGHAGAQEPPVTPKPGTTAESPAMAEHGGVRVSLHELVREAEQKNPQIAASFHAWQASRNVPKQASALPETQLSVQQFSVGSPRPFAGYSNSDFAYIGFGASQDIPYPGKRQLRAQVAEHEADSMEAQTDSMRRTVVGNLKIVYFHLAYIQQTLSVLQRSDSLLTQVEEAAEARYRVGQGNQQDLLKAQLQHTKILQEIAHHHQEEGLLEAQIKQVLGRPQDSADIVAETLTLRALPYTATELLQRAREQNPDVHSKQASIRQQEAKVELAHKNFRPDFNVQYNYEHTGSQTRDYYMATFGIRLPNRGRPERSEEHTSELQSRFDLVCRLLLEAPATHSDLHSFPTRRSSDLESRCAFKAGIHPAAGGQGGAGAQEFPSRLQRPVQLRTHREPDPRLLHGDLRHPASQSRAPRKIGRAHV